MKLLPRHFLAIALTIAALFLAGQQLLACTGITLRAKDGAILYGRTMEWGSFDLQSRLVFIPRGLAYTGATPDGKPGIAWKTKYGVVGIDGVHKDIILDGMNETGLTVGTFYHPGFAEYPKYDPAKANETLGPTDLGQYLLTTCSSVEQARQAMQRIIVAPVVEEAISIVPPVHLLVTEPSGKAIVIEFHKGETKIFDAPLGVITNAPTYDWHETNLRNYINLSPVALPDKKIDDLDFKPLGGGSGMIGLPGDFTPPSRFVRATAFSKTARPTPTGGETMYELFRILDNFNVPLGSAEGGGEDKTKGMRSATLWTTAYDTRNKVMYYHTQHNRRVRRVEFSNVDFNGDKLVRMPLDKVKAEDFEEIVPKEK